MIPMTKHTNVQTITNANTPYAISSLQQLLELFLTGRALTSLIFTTTSSFSFLLFFTAFFFLLFFSTTRFNSSHFSNRLAFSNFTSFTSTNATLTLNSRNCGTFNTVTPCMFRNALILPFNSLNTGKSTHSIPPLARTLQLQHTLLLLLSHERLSTHTQRRQCPQVYSSF